MVQLGSVKMLIYRASLHASSNNYLLDEHMLQLRNSIYLIKAVKLPTPLAMRIAARLVRRMVEFLF
jgi:hypothetical protein